MKIATYNVCLHPIINPSINHTQKKILHDILTHDELVSCDVICFQELFKWYINSQFVNMKSTNDNIQNKYDIISMILGHSSNIFGFNNRELIYDYHIEEFISTLKSLGFQYFCVSDISPNEMNIKSNSGLMIASKIPIIEKHEYLLSVSLWVPNRTLLIVKLSNGIYVSTLHLSPTMPLNGFKNDLQVLDELSIVQKYIKKICGHHKCVLAGDFNIGYKTEQFYAMCNQLGVKPIKNLSITWRASNREKNFYKNDDNESICDYIIGLNGVRYKKKNSTILTIDASDHYPVIADLV